MTLERSTETLEQCSGAPVFRKWPHAYLLFSFSRDSTRVPIREYLGQVFRNMDFNITLERLNPVRTRVRQNMERFFQIPRKMG